MGVLWGFRDIPAACVGYDGEMTVSERDERENMRDAALIRTFLCRVSSEMRLGLYACLRDSSNVDKGG